MKTAGFILAYFVKMATWLPIAFCVLLVLKLIKVYGIDTLQNWLAVIRDIAGWFL